MQANFFALFDTTLVSAELSPGFRGTLLGLVDLVAPLITAVFSPLAGSRGSHEIVGWLFMIKIGSGLVVAGAFFYYSHTVPALMLAVWMFWSRTLTGATFAFFNISVSDVIDEDYVQVRA